MSIRVSPRTRKCSRRKNRRSCTSYSRSFKIRVVKMYLEDTLPAKIICKESGVPEGTFWNWIVRYRKEGETVFSPTRRVSASAVHPEVAEKIVSVKKEHPSFGIRRISAALQRWFLLPAPPATVSKALSEKGLSSPAVRKRSRNVRKPRRFERSTPNQMWQSDIMMFRMGGRQLYLIGYIDDYSRYLTGLGLYLSQTADNVLELYRSATAEHGLPKELLTDNGRQYVNWRGKSRFQKELEKDRIKHIRSRPHHPMTLGKIERFWQSVLDEFLSKAQFDSFDDARERLRLWVQYYNHKRPHQGIQSLCPADRYFEIAGDVRKTIERGVKENALELALRGKTREPFYLVGRMDGQAVTLRAQKGKLKLTVDDALKPSTEEHEFTIDKERSDDNAAAGNSFRRIDPGETASTQEPSAVKCDSISESGSSTESLGGTQNPVTDLPGDEDLLECTEPLAGTCYGGDASGVGAICAAGQGSIPEPPPSDITEKAKWLLPEETDEAVEESGEERTNRRIVNDKGRQDTTANLGNPSGVIGPDGRDRSSPDIGHIPQELSPVAAESACCNEGSTHRWNSGQTTACDRSAEGTACGAGKGAVQPAGAGPFCSGSETDNDRLPRAAEIAWRRFGEAE